MAGSANTLSERPEIMGEHWAFDSNFEVGHSDTENNGKLGK
jgi:hypothetical protein